ncbi:MAG: hypothetical protein EON54_00715 [Alcaligenaceae bacterium]|nr:MAG: hypothetical protein EON54_00715 [Alcaligenaceae bacterium]
MQDLITQLTEAIYSEIRAGRAAPSRIELPPELFLKFQAAHREAMAAVLPEVENVYPGSLCGVPVVQFDKQGATLVRSDNRRRALIVSC